MHRSKSINRRHLRKNKTGLPPVFQEPMEQPPLGFSIAEEKNKIVLKTKQVKKLAAPLAPSNLFPDLLLILSPHKLGRN